eukprot:NODE_3087_length_1428_cov_31.350958_g2682_i0.p1 GENE.NODE_3087_length_1428_cov_31.350958_g2682_i0~~NODE_3087_length_1428_cov_31.350958_g2682_i0.p1  ORF type:complete len:210 (-),score=29.52 NODE_3087_length_1428_cov_31.350958_g2682_i0:454-1083(-)
MNMKVCVNHSKETECWYIGMRAKKVDRRKTTLVAVQCALKCRKSINELIQQYQLTDAKLQIGLASGNAKVGILGTPEMQRFTILGKVMTIASVMCQISSNYNATVLLPNKTAIELDEHFFKVVVDRVRIQRKAWEEEMLLYDIRYFNDMSINWSGVPHNDFQIYNSRISALLERCDRSTIDDLRGLHEDDIKRFNNLLILYPRPLPILR